MSDESLIENYKQSQNQEYIATLYRRYMHLIYGVCMKYLKQKEASEDMTAQVYEKLLEIKPSTEIKDFKKWLYIITRNACVSSLRKEKKETALQEDWYKDEKSQDSFMENEGFLRLTNIGSTETVLSTHLPKFINELSHEQKTCLELFYFEKLSYKEVANETGYSLKEVKSFLQNGKRNLHHKLSNLVRE